MSITIQSFAAFSTKFSEIFPPAAKKAILTLEKSKLSKSLTSRFLFLKVIIFPTLFDDANKYKLSIERSFFSRTSSVFLPTFPVAPTIAISMM